MVPFGLGVLQSSEDSLETALVVRQWVYPLSAVDSSLKGYSILDLLRDWTPSYIALQALASSIHIQAEHDNELSRINIDEANFDTPIRYPNKLLAVGANYAGHLREMGIPVEKWEPLPFFSCPPTSSLVGPGRTVPIPFGTDKFDWECELTVIMGKPISNATREEALDAIAGYTVGLDLSCRDLFQGEHGLTDIIRGKAQPGMKPCGPIFWPKECIGSLDDAPVKLWLNNSLMMDGRTGEMIRRPEECVAEISKVLPLDPGDMIMTGTPAGSATSHQNRWLRKGDLIRAQIASLEALEVEIY